jgi:hypothetical protein
MGHMMIAESKFWEVISMFAMEKRLVIITLILQLLLTRILSDALDLEITLQLANNAQQIADLALLKV